MANKHTEMFNITTFREMQTKAKMKEHCTALRMAECQELTPPNAGEDAEAGRPLWKTIGHFPVKTPTPNNPATPFPGIYSKETKTYVHTETCTNASQPLLVRLKNWN